MKRVVILGSTGSIGVQALQVVATASGLTVAGLSCGRNVRLLLEQASFLGVKDVAIEDERAAAGAGLALYPELRVRVGAGAATRLVREVEADIVLNSIVGFAGLESTIAALETGRPVALANKESLVCAGCLVMRLAADRGSWILPVDSEHSALFQLVGAAGREAIAAAIITASGGPFRGKTREELASVTREAALAHPTWSMGPKITIDSATLMNKGLEVIEAHHLFGLPYESVEVVVHPQSVVHALVRLVDGALLAHLGVADMRVPIAYALHHPHRVPMSTPALDLQALGNLQFEAPDERVFPSIELARSAGARGDRATCSLNAANEVAVHAFLDGRLPFLGISEVVRRVLTDSEEGGFISYDEVVAVDAGARKSAAAACENIARR